MPPAAIMKANEKPKKIKFNDDGEGIESITVEAEDTIKTEEGLNDEDDYFAKRERLNQSKQRQNNEKEDFNEKWFETFTSIICNSDDDIVEIKEKEQMELYNLCKSSYESEKPVFNKRNPDDARWLLTALHKGTAKDRANAGALLVTSNPLGNLEALTTLIGYTKLSNKASTEVTTVLTDLFQEVLLPPQRKLIAINMRGADWKLLRNDSTMSKEKQKRIYAYWYFENELKDCYFEFLKNLQQSLQSGQESNKNSAIVAATKLLSYAPEKEQMLLTMIVNKLGDPLPKVASKALHHLTDVAHRHPNMCSVIVSETEKLLFRNNISDRAQHFALCYLASIATAGTAQVCAKLVNICFALFKVLVQKGAVNNRTMQAILRCLQKAISEAHSGNNNTEILDKDMQDTIYRLVHLADIRISVQTLGLLLQLITVKTEKSDRFYNALYKKMLDLELVNLGTKTAAQLLHIIHRAIHIDANVPRAKAFIKRLLQMTLYMPPQIAAGCLIVIHKILRHRREFTDLLTVKPEPNIGAVTKTVISEVEIDHNETLKTEHANENELNSTDKPSVRNVQKYDPVHRVPAFAGAEYSMPNELLLLNEHVHPTVKLFANSLLNQKKITYYGDPLRDFGLPHFLERFAFKNPKKLEQEKTDGQIVSNKRYSAKGSRGQSVKALTKYNCTEDEMFIFNYLEKKRQEAAMIQEKKLDKSKQDQEEGLKPDDVDDDEFDNYLDGFFGKKAQAAANDDIDFLKELGGDIENDKQSKKKSKKSKNDDEDDDDIDGDWGNDDEDDENGVETDEENDDIDFERDNEDLSEDEEGSIDLNDEDEDGSILSDEDQSDDEFADESDEEAATKHKNKKSKILDENNFARKLKQNKDTSSLFAAADEFAELLEETAKARGQGTAGAILNKDKSSEKQMKWEEKRHSNAKNYTSERKRKNGFGNSKVKSKKFAKKFKH